MKTLKRITVSLVCWLAMAVCAVAADAVKMSVESQPDFQSWKVTVSLDNSLYGVSNGHALARRIRFGGKQP